MSQEQRPDNDALPDGVIWTPEIESMVQWVALLVRIDVPGAEVYGKMRIGKSFAAAYLRETLSSVVGYPVEVIAWEISENSEDRPREFLQARMVESGYRAISPRDVEVLKDRFFPFLVQRCAAKGTRRLIVVIDEAQNLTRRQFGYLVGYFNKLTTAGLKPFFLLIGQPELGSPIDLNGVGRDMQIVGRFRVNQHHFRGVALERIEDVLKQFDCSGPDGGPPESMTSFLPQAYSNGWRIVDLAPALREGVLLVKQKHNVSDEIRLPMQFVRSTISAYIHRLAHSDLNPAHASAAVMIDCMQECGFLNVFSYYAEPVSNEGGKQ
ncbi:ATP-binding protein [Paraburkholderia sp. EG286B]|uniref:ATP-binding protein n=1 Tax=Paraburkholderia sp. EG286B TaxID=3237011 RepID=UPI0034D2FDCC